MTPLQLIEKGILGANWESVCEGYKILSGNNIPVPSKMVEKYDIESALRKIANIVNCTVVVETTPSDTTTKKKKRKSNRPRKKKSIKPTNNEEEEEEDNSIVLDSSQITPVKFSQIKTDEFQFITNELDPKEIERNKIRARKTTTIQRMVPKKYQAECSECSNKFESDRPTGEIGQMCRNCLQGKKSRFNG